ncbi:hypothetical protein ABPG75_011997 [Micractinium tetrahymenae]
MAGLSQHACTLLSRSCTMAPISSPTIACGRQAHSFPRTRLPVSAPARVTCPHEHHKTRCHAARPRQRRNSAPHALPPVVAAAAAAAGGGDQPPAAQDLPLLLDGVQVVLVSPKTPANIGAVLRVAENFEAHDVVIVDPRCDPRCGEVAKTSVLSPLVESLRVVPTLADALADCTGSIGFTRRAGARRTVHASLRQLLARFPTAVPALLDAPQPLRQGSPSAPAVAAAAAGAAAGNAGGSAAAAGPAAAAAQGGTVALVFGREESGLLESELLLCSHACAIPTGRAQPSLNLSHAAAVVLSQLFDLKQQRLLQLQAAGQAGGSGEEQQQQADLVGGLLGVEAGGASGSLFEDERLRWRREQALSPASQAELEALLSRAAALLEAAGISAEESSGGGNNSNHGRKKKLMGHIRALLLRSQASTAEVRALHGLCKELEGRQRQAAQAAVQQHQ